MSSITSCHCGAVSASVDAELTEGMACNCSICRRKGHILAFVPRAQMTVLGDEAAITTYRFNKQVIQHKFCKVCGCAPFGEGEMPDGTKMAAINLRCIDGLDLSAVTITDVDGASF